MKEKIKHLFLSEYRTIKSYLYFPIRFYRLYKEHEANPLEKRFANNLSFFKAKRVQKKKSGIVLVQMVKDYESTIKLAAASKVIAEKYNLQVNFYEVDIDWIWSKKETSNRKKFNTPLEFIYLSFGSKILFSNSEKYNNQEFIASKLKEITDDLFKNNIESLLHLKFDGILVGDLLYDTYLRFFNKPTIEKIDKELIHIIEVALNVFYNFKALLNENNIKVLLNTYSSYIHHGIPARLCLHYNIPVYTIGSYSYIIQKLEKNYPYHQINHTLFSPDKKLRDDQLELAKQKFLPRFEGNIDEATSYMRSSAFSDKPMNHQLKKLFAEKSRNIVIYVHDFYDSPHINRMLQFPDLFQFLKQTLNVLVNLEDTNVFIKTHPNGITGCKEITIELVNSFNNSHFHIIDESVSNLHIIELKPDLIATARGTVCLEMAYFEIPTIALFDNLFVNFNFTHTCYDKESYFSILKGERKPKNDFNKEHIFSFYYQAFIEKQLMEENNIFTLLATFKGDTYNDKYLEFILSHSKEIFNTKMIGYYGNIPV